MEEENGVYHLMMALVGVLILPVLARLMILPAVRRKAENGALMPPRPQAVIATAFRELAQ